MACKPISILALSLSAVALLVGLSAADANAGPPTSAMGGGDTVLFGHETQISFNAHVEGDSPGAKGHANVLVYYGHGNPYHITIDIDCLLIENGNFAVMSGEIIRSELDLVPDFFEVGDTAIFSAEDNGEGGGQSDDGLSEIYSYSTSVTEACLGFIPPVTNIGNGNVQVHP
jgi:hypothetical protein